jgi:hypothetical protein
MSNIKIGDKVVGFKFECEDEGVHWSSEMEAYVGREGKVEYIGHDFFVLTFDDGAEWGYPIIQVNKAMQRETVFKVGQRVYDITIGVWGTVTAVRPAHERHFPVSVKMDDKKYGILTYTLKGSLSRDDAHPRVLYFDVPDFSAVENPKFVPTLKSGDVVVAVSNDGSHKVAATVQREEENQIMVDQDLALEKDSWKFYRVANEPLEL